MISPVRRTTIVVNDMDQSLKFYQDMLGMNPFYDQIIEAEASAKLMGVPNCRVRIVSLQADDCVNGMVGLLQFFRPELKSRSRLRGRGLDPDAMLLFMADDIDVSATHQRLQDSGVEIVCPPLTYDAPERGPISGFSCKDPDGVLVAVMRFGNLQTPDGHIKASPTRRTTIAVTDINQSMAFYRDTLGMDVFYDQIIDSREEGRMLGVPGATVRMVSLQSQGSLEGMVGLMEFQSPAVKPRQAAKALIDEPDILLIFLTEQMNAVYTAIRKSGFGIKCPPVEYEIPGRGLCAGFTCYDPDGIVIEFTQFGPL